MFNTHKPIQSLPISEEFKSTDDYVDSLLEFLTSSYQLQTFTGGIHILDFFTRTPDLYETILPQDWRDWLEAVDVYHFLELLLRQDLDGIDNASDNGFGGAPPPASLLHYISQIRRHSLVTDFDPLPIPEVPRKQKVKFCHIRFTT